MFNSNTYTNTYNNTVNIKPACSGMLQKSHPKSFFKRCGVHSEAADWLLSEEPSLKKLNRYHCTEIYMHVVVLQVMVFGDNQLLFELLNVEDLCE